MQARKKAQNIGMEMFPLSPRKVRKKTVEGTLIGVSVVTIIYSALAIYITQAGGADVITILMALVGYIFFIFVVYVTVYLYQTWYYAYYFYDFHDDYLTVKKGPLIPKQTTVPYNRIQDVYIDQDFLDRMLDLYDLHVSVGGNRKADIHIDGLSKDISQKLLEFIMRSISFSEKRETGQAPRASGKDNVRQDQKT